MDEFRKAKFLIAENKHLSAVELIEQICLREGINKDSNIIILKGRINRVQENYIKNTINTAKYDRQLNQISDSIIQFIDSIDQNFKSGSITNLTIKEPNFKELPVLDNLEKIINGNTLCDISWLESGIKAASNVCRITIKKNGSIGYGTGFLIDQFLITNNHVLTSIQDANSTNCEFGYQTKIDGTLERIEIINLIPEKYFLTSEEYDFTIVEIEKSPTKIENLNISKKEPSIGEFISIIQHPSGGPKKIVTNGSRITNKLNQYIQYTTDTLPGSSGSPIFDMQWQIIGIHHAGGNLKVDKFGNKKFINQGIMWSEIMSKFKDKLPLTLCITA